MQFFKNYKFYVIIASIVCILIVKIFDIFGMQADMEVVQNVITYILSALIAYNVITIDSVKSEEDIKKDVEKTVKSINLKVNKSQKQEKNNTSNEDISHTN